MPEKVNSIITLKILIKIKRAHLLTNGSHSTIWITKKRGHRSGITHFTCWIHIFDISNKWCHYLFKSLVFLQSVCYHFRTFISEVKQFPEPILWGVSVDSITIKFVHSHFSYVILNTILTGKIWDWTRFVWEWQNHLTLLKTCS